MNRSIAINSVSYLLLFFLMILTACDSLKKVQTPDKSDQADKEELDEIQGKRVFNPETGEYEIVTDVTGTLDTIIWKEPTAPTTPPITSEATQRAEGTPQAETEYLSIYNLVLPLPFLADKLDLVEDKIDKRSIPALNFYEGAKMAFDVLSTEGVNLDVSVLDTRASENTTQRLTNNYDLINAHLIIGTFRNSTARAIANFSLNNKKTFVSPIYPHQNLTQNNPYFIQLNPSEKTHCEAIMKHVKEKFPINRIVVFGRNSPQEQRLMRYYLEAHYALEGGTFADSIQLVTITDESSGLEDTDLVPYMDEINTTAFVIASSSQTFVYSMLRKIDLDKEDRSIVVYGQPRWKDFNNISYEYYETMNVHISSESFIDTNQEAIQNFREAFFNKYGMPPTEEAFKGYDTILYFGRLLKELGTGFANKIDVNPADGLHTRFDIQRIVTTPQVPLEGEALNQFDQLMNKHLNILEFTDYQFRRAD